jgi:hypothetical protein
MIRPSGVAQEILARGYGRPVYRKYQGPTYRTVPDAGNADGLTGETYVDPSPAIFLEG